MANSDTAFAVKVGNRTVTTHSLAYAASQARATTLGRGVARITDSNGDSAVVRVAEVGGFRVEYEAPLVLFPSSSGQPFWVQRLVALLAEHG